MSDVVLKIGHQRHLGWTSLSITRGVEQAAHGFELSLTHRWADAEPPLIKSGQPCQVWLDQHLLINGYTDAVNPSYSASDHTITVAGRSKVADLIDCSKVGQEFRGLDLLQIAQRLAAPFDVDVLADVPVGQPFNVARISSGQSIFEFLEQLARVRAVRFVSTGDGDLTITTAGAGFADVALMRGVNVISASASLDLSGAYSQYTVLAQQEGVQLGAAEQASISADSQDNRIGRHRPLVMETDGPADLAAASQRAQVERNTRYARGQSATLTVPGWYQQDDGRPWQPNELVQVEDDWLRISGERLITRVVMRRDDQGSRTELTVMPQEALTLTPLPEPENDTNQLGFAT